jgi:hypothetical protein
MPATPVWISWVSFKWITQDRLERISAEKFIRNLYVINLIFLLLSEHIKFCKALELTMYTVTYSSEVTWNSNSSRQWWRRHLLIKDSDFCSKSIFVLFRHLYYFWDLPQKCNSLPTHPSKERLVHLLPDTLIFYEFWDDRNVLMVLQSWVNY